ncbi:MAG: molybdopterin-guanine dinucleotide biosynthesis protein B [Comamonas sp.]
MNVLGIAGYSGAGKTTLLEGLIPALAALGQRVSVVKHAHHDFEVDTPGKDSWRHRKAGAHEVLVASDQRWALMRELPAAREPDWRELVGRLDAEVDWVLLEGFKHGDLPKLEIWRAANGKPLGAPRDARIVALAKPAADTLPESLPAGLPVLDLDRPQAIAQWLLAQAGRFAGG